MPLRSAAVLLLCAACAHTAEPGPVVRAVTFVGNEHLDDGELADAIVTTGSSWVPFTARHHFDPNVWTTDLERLERYYHSRGFYQAEVVEDAIEPVGEDAVRLRVRIREGEPTVLTHLAIHGLEDLPEEHRARVLEVVTLREGERFEEPKWEPLKGALVAALVDLGYAEAKAEGQAKVDLATHQASIDVQVTPGVRYRPGEVHVVTQPGARVEAWRIREQVEEAIKGEEWYSQEVREEVQQRVFGLGVFGAAQVTPEKGDPVTQRLPLRVEVQETAFHEVAAGFGLGVEQRRNEIHAIGEYTDRDFLGGLRRLQLTARAGWAFIPNAWSVLGGGNVVTRTGPIARLDAQLDQPRFFHPDFRIHGELEAERAIEPAYSFIGGRLKLGVPWRPWSWLEVQPAYDLELYRLDAGQVTLSEGTPQLLFGCERACVLSYLEQRAAIDRRDDPQEPHRGYYLALSVQEGGGPLGGSFDYVRISPEVRGYVPLTREQRVVLAGRLKLGTLIPVGAEDTASPIVARYFSGGDEMRGFSTQRLSPMQLERKSNPKEGETFNAEPVPIGGNGLFEASVEARYAISPTLVIAAFVDTGFVTAEQLQWSDPSYFTRNLLWAVGGGIRYRTPVGPIRLDLAYRLPFGPPLQVSSADPALTYDPSSGCFGIGRSSPNRGGAPEGVCAIHLSVGEAF
ncbi:MAG: BamA/TamA family outer membrane protein [Myxococcaceae bacterium]|nr:BamA/TamA family outer membrane protein [Myxococcaceae bacterium]